MHNNSILAASEILRGTGISIVDAARVVRNILDTKESNIELNDISYLSKFVSFGDLHFQSVKSVLLRECLDEYLSFKSYLKPDSKRDIKKVFGRLIRNHSEFYTSAVSCLASFNWENILDETFTCASQFNKARAILHAFFNFCLRRNFCVKNPISKISPKRVIENEIFPLKIPQIKALLENSATMFNGNCAPALGLMLWAGIRPNEVKRLYWKDIDFSERAIVVKQKASKTGGGRQVEMQNILKAWLVRFRKGNSDKICPKNFDLKWKCIRNQSGFKGVWVQDVLRHTFASYHAKRFKNLPKLQSDMGHFDLSLLRSRYLNLTSISNAEAKMFFCPKKLFTS